MLKRVVWLSAAVVAMSMIAGAAQAQPPGAPPQGPRPKAGPSEGRGPNPLQGPPQAKDESEQKILDVLNDLDRNQRRGNMNVPVEDGRLLRMLAESLDAKTVVEFGTSNGYSGIWFCLALRKTGGKLITHDMDPVRIALAKQNFARAGVSPMVTIVEGDAHETAKQLKGPIDLVFIDADKEGYLDYLQKVVPLVKPGGLIVAHNMVPRMAHANFVKAITTDPNLETIYYMEGGGASITMKKR